MVLHEGWSVLTLADDRVLAGLLRLEHIGIVEQWAIDVPPNGVHKGYTAILSPQSITSVRPCSEAEARSAALTHKESPVEAIDVEPTGARPMV